MNEHVDVLSTEATNTVACNEETDLFAVEEEWRPVADYTDRYLISSLGRVRTAGGARWPEHIIKQTISRGFAVVVLIRPKCEGYKHDTVRVDDLVYNTFVAPLQSNEILVHRDGDPLNNCAWNLKAVPQILDPLIEWKPVVGYEEHYEVSNKGDIRNKHNGRLLVPKLDRYGYLHLGLRYKKPRKWLTVHRAVAEAFIPNPENKATADHINGNKLDNRPENLRWASNSENFHNPVTFGFFKSRAFRDLKKDQQAHLNKAVICLTDPPVFYEAVHEAARQTGVLRCNIVASCKRFSTGKSTVTNRNGRPVLHWRWATPEEAEAKKVLL